MPTPARNAVILASLVGLAACKGNGSDDPDAPPSDASPACELAKTYQEFSTIQTEIFNRPGGGQCAFMDCHDASSPEAMMDLTAANARDMLVGVDATMEVAAGFKRVVAGSPSTSYLMIILGEFTGPIDSDVGTMPQNSPILCQEKRDAIERWITAGALDD